MWTDLAKFGHFGTILSLATILMPYLVFCQILIFFGKNIVLLGKVLSLHMSKYYKIIQPSGHIDSVTKCWKVAQIY